MNTQRRSSTTLSILFLSGIIGLSSAPALGQARFDTLDFYVRDMSAGGTVLVGQDQNGALIWSLAGGRQQIAAEANVTAISGDGSVVAGYYLTGSNRGDVFLWTQEGGARPISAVFGAVPSAWDLNGHRSLGLSEDGSTVVGTGGYDPGDAGDSRPDEAYRWSEVGGFRGLGPSDDNDEACDWSSAIDVSADGSVVVGWRNIDECLVEAIRWTGGTVQGLGFLDGGWDSRATAVSADGSTVVGSNWRSHENEEAFRWTQSSGMEGLGFLDEEKTFSYALDVSGDGSVVVGKAMADDFPTTAFIWTATDGMRRLQDVLEDDYETDLKGWTLNSAEAVSDDGSIIAGIGQSAFGFSRSWRVVLCRSDVSWANASGGVFADEANWTLNAAPDSMGNARFATSGTYTVTFDDDAVSNRLEAANGTDVTLDLGGHTWALMAGCTAPSVQIESAYLDVGNGTIEAVESVVLSGEDPVLNVDSDGRLVVDSDEDGSGCLAADGESGEALVSVAGEVDSRTCSILGGSAETTGRLVMDTGGRFTTDTLTAGGGGEGFVEIAQGNVSVDVLQMALEESATAAITVENVGTLHFQTSAEIGVRGKADLLLTNVGLSAGGDEGEVSLLVLGREQHGQGQLILEDHSFFKNSDAVVGQDGLGNIQVKSGSTADIRRIWIGGHLESTEGVGGVYVDGAGSRLTARRIWIGRGGYGELKVTNGGWVEADRIEVYGYGNTEESGGTIAASILYVGGTGGAGKTGQSDEQGVAVDTLVLSGERATLTADAIVFGEAGTLDFALGEAVEGGATSLSGAVTLGGTLRLVRLQEYVPEVGREYTILTAPSVEGVFDQIVRPEDVAVDVSYTPTEVKATVTSVSVSREKEVGPARDYALHEPYPNPFHQSARIAFELPETAEVHLTVYDILGREVARLAQGRYAAGRHEVVFAARDLPNGAYLLRWEAGGFTQSRTVMLAH